MRRVVVDYDHLLKDPEYELARVARMIGLPEPTASSVADYRNEFLEEKLRHSTFTLQDLNIYPAVPCQVFIAYEWLVRLSNDNIASDSSEIQRVFEKLTHELIAITPALNLIARQEQQTTMLLRTEARREQSIAALQAQVQDLLTGNTWLTSQRQAWEQTAAEREQSIAALQAQVQDLLTGNTWLTSQSEAWEHTAAEREQSIAALQARLLETEQRLAVSSAMLHKIRTHWAVRWANYLFKKRLF
jgi:hypothetical protein